MNDERAWGCWFPILLSLLAWVVIIGIAIGVKRALG